MTSEQTYGDVLWKWLKKGVPREEAIFQADNWYQRKMKKEATEMTDHKGLPVKGYSDQTSEAVQMVNLNKQDEERILRSIDLYAMNPDVDKRWLSIAKTHIEQGFMAMNRAIFKPQRIQLDDE